MIVEPTFGNLLKQLRSRSGLSLVKLAERAQISPRTLSYWEAGKISPRSVELQKVMEVLGASEAEKLEAFTLLTTRRGIQMARKEVDADYTLPELGDLLRAMRLRHAWTQRQLACKLGVSTSTVQRWEISESLPSEEEMERACRYLEAYPEEKAALLTRLEPPTFMECDRDALNSPLESGEGWIRQFTCMVSYLETPLMDLYALALKRKLLLQATQHPEAFDLLLRLEADYGYWLFYQNRRCESHQYIRRILKQLREMPSALIASRVPDELWSRLLNTASAYVATDPRALASAVQFLHSWLPLVPKHKKYSIWCDMALYSAQADRKDDALFYLQKAGELIPIKDEAHTSPFFATGPEGYYRLTTSRVMAYLGHKEEAADYIQNVPIPEKGIERINDLIMRSEILLLAKETRIASDYLNQASALVEQRPNSLNQERLDRLTQKL